MGEIISLLQCLANDQLYEGATVPIGLCNGSCVPAALLNASLWKSATLVLILTLSLLVVGVAVGGARETMLTYFHLI